MKTLTLEHLAFYLPYGLKQVYTGNTEHLGVTNHLISEIHPSNIMTLVDSDTLNKPILRPLSDLTKEIEHNGEKFVPIKWLEDKYYTLDLHKQCKRLLKEDGENWINQTEYMLVQHLLEWHFDIFGLIEQDLAIDINTLEK